MVSDDFKCSYYRFVPGSTPEQATDTSTNTSQRNPVNPFSATTIPYLKLLHLKVIIFVSHNTTNLTFFQNSLLMLWTINVSGV